MEQIQKIKNRLGSIYIAILAFTALKIIVQGLEITDIVLLVAYIGLFISLQTKLLNIKIQCILSIVAGILLIVIYYPEEIMILLSAWLIVYSIISLSKLKKNTDI